MLPQPQGRSRSVQSKSLLLEAALPVSQVTRAHPRSNWMWLPVCHLQAKLTQAIILVFSNSPTQKGFCPSTFIKAEILTFRDGSIVKVVA